MLIDTHAHIQFDPDESKMDGVLRRAEQAEVKYVVCPGIDPETSRKAIELTEQYENVFATVGIHPHDCEALPSDWLHQIEELAAHQKVVALGEMGLDYFKDYTPRSRQRAVFREQLALAKSLNLPVVVHNREADEDIETLLAEDGTGSGVLHCFTSSLEFAERMVDRGYHISFTGIATFGNTTVEQAIRGLDLNHMMVETDSPFLAPVPHRGKTNEPAYVRFVAEKISELKDIPVEEVARITTENARQFFRLPV